MSMFVENAVPQPGEMQGEQCKIICLGCKLQIAWGSVMYWYGVAICSMYLYFLYIYTAAQSSAIYFRLCIVIIRLQYIKSCKVLCSLVRKCNAEKLIIQQKTNPFKLYNMCCIVGLAYILFDRSAKRSLMPLVKCSTVQNRVIQCSLVQQIKFITVQNRVM